MPDSTGLARRLIRKASVGDPHDGRAATQDDPLVVMCPTCRSSVAAWVGQDGTTHLSTSARTYDVIPGDSAAVTRVHHVAAAWHRRHTRHYG